MIMIMIDYLSFLENQKMNSPENASSHHLIQQSSSTNENDINNKNGFNDGREVANTTNSKPDQQIPPPQQSLKDRILASIMSVPDDEDTHSDKDICRVCRLSGDDTLYHPCLCTGSIKYVHQDCLLQWLKYSKKDVCELCNHKFSFKPLYRADMPERLPLWDLLRGVFLIMARFMRLTLTYTLVASCWLGLVPLMAARTHRLVFSGLLSSFFSSRILQLFSTENVAVDIVRGSLVVTLFLCTFISLVWLREQIMIGGPAHFLHLPEEQQPTQQPNPGSNQQQADPSQVNQHDGNNPQVQDKQAETAQTSSANEETSAGTSSNLLIPTTMASSSMDNGNESNQPTIGEDQATSSSSSEPRQSSPNRQLSLQHFQPVQPDLVQEPQQQQQPANDNQQQAVVQNADIVEQQRFVDELTWQRLLGLDGSFAFLEHVFWTISLNLVFNVVFLYLPAQIGASILTLLGMGPGKAQYFELPISIMTGLLVILLHGLVIHRIAKIFRVKSLYTTAGMICLMLKVFLLVVTELVIFPILCGWWLDICSLPLTGVTLEERIRNFRQYPSSSMFLHWLTGMIYVFYSASFILILRELLRPGVLWFIRNLHDPDFNPIQEMIEQPITQHLRRLISSMTLFFSIIMLVIYIPLRVIKWLHPSTLPYVFSGSADTPLVEYSFELILLQVIMPTILEYSKVFSLLKRAVRLWCRVVGGWLQLDSYLLPADKDRQDADQREQQRQRARDRLLRGDQEEQIGLLEALEAIEDDTTDDDDDDDENENEGEENGENAAARSDNADSEHSEVENAGNINAEGETSTARENPDSDAQTTLENNNNEAEVPPVDVELPVPAAGELPVEVVEPLPVDGEQPQQEQPAVPEDQQVQQRIQEQREQRNLGVQHHALLRFRDTTSAEDYVKPSLFPLRIVILLFFVALTAELIAMIFFFVPVTIGRTLLSCLALTNQPVHDLYTVAAGLYTCWIAARLAMLTREWARKGWTYMKKVFSTTVWLLLRIVAAAFPLLVVIPFMLGFYFQMLVISPLRVAIFQSPLFFPWKEWAMGVVHFKIICASILMGPDWWLKTAFEQIYADGIWNFRLRDLYINLVLPIVNTLAFLIAYPYALSKFVLLFVDVSREEEVIVTRYSYPFLLGSICALAFLTWQWQKLKMLAQKIRNDKYLIGTQLVNFYREATPAHPPTSKSVAVGQSESSSTETAMETGNNEQSQPNEQPAVGQASAEAVSTVTRIEENVQQ